MATIPAASPSSPSMKLTAFAMPITQSTVMSGARSRGTDQISPKGTRKKSIVTPNSDSVLPAST